MQDILLTLQKNVHKHRERISYPKLVFGARLGFLDEHTVVGGDVLVVTELLQHVDFCFDLILLILTQVKTEISTGIWIFFFIFKQKNTKRFNMNFHAKSI